FDFNGLEADFREEGFVLIPLNWCKLVRIRSRLKRRQQQVVDSTQGVEVPHCILSVFVVPIVRQRRSESIERLNGQQRLVEPFRENIAEKLLSSVSKNVFIQF